MLTEVELKHLEGKRVVVVHDDCGRDTIATGVLKTITATHILVEGPNGQAFIGLEIIKKIRTTGGG